MAPKDYTQTMKDKRALPSILGRFANSGWAKNPENGNGVADQKLGGIGRMTDAREKAQSLVSDEELARYKQFVQDSLTQIEHSLSDDNEDTLGTFGSAAWNYFHLLQAQYDFVREEHSVTHTGDPRVFAMSKRKRKGVEKRIEEYRAELERLVENSFPD